MSTKAPSGRRGDRSGTASSEHRQHQRGAEPRLPRGHRRGFFTASDFDPLTAVLTNAKYDKSLLTKGGTQGDGASLSGINRSVGNIHYSWAAPADLAPQTWVCFFARDIRNDHGGGGNRKVPPTCHRVLALPPPPPPPQVSTPPEVSLAYADDLHLDTPGVQFLPSPWRGDPGVVYVGCVEGTPTCGAKLDARSIRVFNPTGNLPLTLTAASVDAGPCHFVPWGALLPAPPAAAGGSIVLTQTGQLGPPAPSPCDGRVSVADRPSANFDTSEGPFDTLSPPYSSCDATRLPAPVIHLTFSNGTTVTATDADKILPSGGVDRNACSGLEEAAPWTPVAAANVVLTVTP